MKCNRFFLILLLFFIPLVSQGNFCSEIYGQKMLSDLVAVQGPRLELKADEVAESGFLINKYNSQNMTSQILGRDGTYPLIINRAGDVVIGHRLPSRKVNPEKEAFLATHRSLYNRLLKSGKNTEVIYAAQIKVLGGKSVHLVDQSGTFHDRVSDIGSHASNADLVISNGKRIEYGVEILKQVGLIDSKTEVMNFWDTYGSYSDGMSKRFGHQSDREAARYEIKCGANPACWETYTQIKKLVHQINEKGGSTFLIARMKATGELFLEWFEVYQILNTMLKEGVLDVLSQPQNDVMNTEGHRKKAHIKQLVENMNEFKVEFLGFKNL